MPTTLLRLDDVMKKTGLKRSSLYKRIAEGSFPRPVAISSQSRAWIDTEVDDWIKGIIEQSRPPVTADSVSPEKLNGTPSSE